MMVLEAPPEEFLTVKETAKLLRLHPVTLWRMERAGEFVPRVQRSARLTGFIRGEVMAWIRARPRGLREPVCGKKAVA